MAFTRELSRSWEKWRWDLQELWSGVRQDPWFEKNSRQWDRDFGGELTNREYFHVGFLVALSMLPAVVNAYVSSAPLWKVLHQFFRAPLQAVIAGMLCSAILFIGAHVNRKEKPYSVAFKLMLRIMSIHPLLAFFWGWPLGEPLGLIVFGYFVARGAKRTYGMAPRAALMFYGTIYVVFAVLQLRAVL